MSGGRVPLVAAPDASVRSAFTGWTRPNENRGDKSCNRWSGASVPPSPSTRRDDQEAIGGICSEGRVVGQGIPVFRDTGIQDRS